MPIYKDNNGSYYVKLRKKDPVTDKWKQITKRGFKTRREAVKWEAEKIASTELSTDATFMDVFEMYADSSDQSDRSKHSKKKWFEDYFSEYCNRPIESITRVQLVTWRNSLKDCGLAVGTINNGIKFVRSVFSFYSRTYGRVNACATINLYKKQREEKSEKMQVWTPEEFNRFLSCVDMPIYKAFFSFLYWTGCRKGEAIALTKDCFIGNRCHIYRTMKDFKNGFRPPKTDSSERTITIDPTLMKMIEPYIEKADPFIFGTIKCLPRSRIDYIFKKGIINSGVKKIRIHDLRHSHASLLIANGANIVAVSKRLGHATINQTIETYTHLIQKSEDELMEKLADIHKE